MRVKDKVITPYGEGIIVQKEGLVGILSTRMHVRLIGLRPDHPLYELHKRQGKLAFFKSELKKCPKPTERMKELF